MSTLSQACTCTLTPSCTSLHLLTYTHVHAHTTQHPHVFSHALAPKHAPGTTMAGQNATCSFSAKWLSGLRLSTMRPMGCRGKMSSGHVLATSRGSKLNLRVRYFICAMSGLYCAISHSGSMQPMGSRAISILEHAPNHATHLGCKETSVKCMCVCHGVCVCVCVCVCVLTSTSACAGIKLYNVLC